MYQSSDDVYLCGAQRTPIGSFDGALRTVPAVQLGAEVLRAVTAKTDIPQDEVDEVIMGCVLSAGLGQAPARQAARFAGLSDSVQALTVNKVCSSGPKAVLLAANSVCLSQTRAIRLAARPVCRSPRRDSLVVCRRRWAALPLEPTVPDHLLR